MIVIAAVAADIDHRIDRGRAAQPLAARLIADPAIEARLRHGIEGPVVDLAGDHQDHRARRGDDPVVVPAAGFQQRHRGLGILGQAAGHRAAAGTAAHHYKIERIRHGHPPVAYAPRLGFCVLSGKSSRQAPVWPILAVIKSRKDRSRAFSKPPCQATLHWYIPLAPKGICPGCLLRKPPDGIDRRPWAWAKSVSVLVFCEGAQWFIAGWSSPVARQAHNLKVIGSNPIPATRYSTDKSVLIRKAAFGAAFLFPRIATGSPPHLQSPAMSSLQSVILPQTSRLRRWRRLAARSWASQWILRAWNFCLFCR